MAAIGDLGEPRVACYVVTDIETDGPTVGIHSMRSFASAVVLADGTATSTFSGSLEPLPAAQPHPKTLSWFQENPLAWENATYSPRPAVEVMTAYAAWLRDLPWPRVFVSHPLTFDGLWIDWYLRRFVGKPLLASLFDSDLLFAGDGIDLPSFIAGRMRVDYSQCVRRAYPREWFGGYEHTHKALDDARGYASVLGRVLRGG